MAASQHTNAFPVESYLRGRVAYAVTDEAILSILIDRGVPSGASVESLSRKDLDLCTADLYMWCATLPSVTASVEDADAGWRHKEGGSQITDSDKSRLIRMANDIYVRYGEKAKGSGFKMISKGMRIW